MVKRYSLSRKLAGYSALATAILAAKEADAQIVYTALNPNVILYTPIQNFNADISYYLDLNNDGNPDFKFTAGVFWRESMDGTFFQASSAFILARGINSNKVDTDEGDIYGITIGNKNIWSSEQILARHFNRGGGEGSSQWHSSGTSGYFYNKSDKYLPLKLVNNGKNYYGWARLTCISEDELIINDYAYNTIADSSIKAGYTGCSYAPTTPIISIKGDTLLSSQADKYQWYSSGIQLTNDTANFTIATEGESYSVLTIDSNGCMSQSTAYYFDSCSNVKPFISGLAVDTSCEFIQLELIQPALNGTFKWQYNGNLINGTVNNIYFNADSSGSYSVIFTDTLEGCTTISNIINVTIKQPPPSPYIYQVCDTLFTAEGNYHIQWYDSSYNALNDTSNKFIPPDLAEYYYVSYSNGVCINYSIADYYTPFNGVLQTINGENSNVICTGDSTTLYYFADGFIDSTTKYQWQKNGVNINGANQSYYVTDSIGTYSLIINSGSCVAYCYNFPLTDDTIKPTIYQSGDTIYTQYANYYQWYLNDTALINADLQYYLPTRNGIYTVSVYDTNFCYHQSLGYNYIASGIQPINQQSDLIIYNYNKLLHIQLNNESMLGSPLEIYNVIGQKVYSTTLTSSKTEINLNDLMAGLYIVRVTGKNSTITKKIVIE